MSLYHVMPSYVVYIWIVGIIAGESCAVFCPKYANAVEEGRTCRKPCNNDTQCRGIYKRCLCDDVCGMSCFNPDSECDPPDPIENGRMRWNRVIRGGKVIYECYEGYFMEGSNVRTCHSDRKWSGIRPNCTRGCGQPESNDDSSPAEFSTGYAAGEYKFVCPPGFYMEGSPNRTCSTVFKWSVSRYECRRQHCYEPDPIRHGTIVYTNGLQFGSTATLQCNRGYSTSPPVRSMTCYGKTDDPRYADWIGTLPRCTIVSCPDPLPPVNGWVEDVGEREYGSRVTYRCDVGFKVQGQSVVTCGEDRNWDQAPTCIVDADCNFNDYSSPTCGYTNRLKQWRRIQSREPQGYEGFILQSSSYGASLTSPVIPMNWTEDYACLKFFYKLDRRDTKLKVQNAMSSSEYYFESQEKTNTNWLSAVLNFRQDSEVQYRFKVDSGQVSLDDVTVLAEKCKDHCDPMPCENRGTCVNREERYTCFCPADFTGATCSIDLKCPVPVNEIPHGALRTRYVKYLPRTTVDYVCDEDYKIEGADETVYRVSITCEAAGSYYGSSWSSDPTTIRCTKITCPPPLVSDNQRIIRDQDTWEVHDVAYYVCNQGNEFFDPRLTNIRCLNIGEWSGPAPRCIVPTCDYEALRNDDPFITGPRSPWHVNVTAHFACKLGFELRGRASLTCIARDRWDGAYPTCRRRSCGLIPVVENSNNVDGRREYYYGHSHRYECDPRYYLAGPQEITCQADGTWSEIPQCKEMGDCSIPHAPEHGSVVVLESMREVKFRCDKMYDIRGRDRAICQLDGAWSKPPVCIEKAPERRIVKNSIQYLPYLQNELKSNFSEAKKLCESIDANLAVIYQRQVQEHLESQLKLIDYGFDLYIGTVRRNATPPETKSKYFDWIMENISTRLPHTPGQIRRMKFGNWKHGDPLLDGGDCGVIYKEKQGFMKLWAYSYKWQNLLCSQKRSFLCQRNYDPCRPNPCDNDGLCRRRGVKPVCYCAEGYKGAQCKQKITCKKPVTAQVIISHVDGQRSAASSTYNPRQTIGFECMKSTERINIAYSTLECLPSGNWNGTVPGCVRVCSSPAALPNSQWARRLKAYYFPNERVFFSCDDGYEFTGAILYTTCQSDGQWEPLNGACADRSHCSPNPCQNGGQCSFTEEGYFCVCQADFEGTNCEFGPACEKPILPDRAYIEDDPQDYSTGTELTISCFDGYVLLGPPAMRCLASGLWNTTQNGVCKTNRCRLDVYLLPDGVQIEGYTDRQLYNKKFEVNETATLRCKCGGPPVSSDGLEAASTCELGGGWSPDVSEFSCERCQDTCILPNRFKCQDNSCISVAKTCDGINDCPNGEDETYVQARCAHSRPCRNNPCVNGGTCRARRKNRFFCLCLPWFYGKHCERAIKCGSLPAITNGRWNDSGAGLAYPVSAEVALLCDYGYYAENELTKCMTDGRWHPRQVKCMKIECAAPEPPEKGFIFDKVESYGYGDKAIFSCLEDNVLVGDFFAECTKDGWRTTKNRTTKCIRSICVLDRFLLPEGVSVQGYTPRQLYYKRFSVDDFVTLQCPPPALPFKGDSPFSPPILRCSLGGSWIPTYGDLRCVEQSQPMCNFPILPKNVLLRDNYDLIRFPAGTELMIRCGNNHTVEQFDKIVCHSDGSWSETSGCERAECRVALSDVDNGMQMLVAGGEDMGIERAFKIGESLLIVCSEQNKLPFITETRTIANTTQCLEDGRWFPEISDITCFSVCGKPPETENGMTILSSQGSLFLANQVIPAECPPNYRNVGVSQIECLDDGTWSRTDGCEPTGCWIDTKRLHRSIKISGYTNDSLSDVEFGVEHSLELQCAKRNHTIENNMPKHISCLGLNIWSQNYRQYKCVVGSWTCEDRCLLTDGPCACDFDCEERDDCCGDFDTFCLK